MEYDEIILESEYEDIEHIREKDFVPLIEDNKGSCLAKTEDDINAIAMACDLPQPYYRRTIELSNEFEWKIRKYRGKILLIPAKRKVPREFKCKIIEENGHYPYIEFDERLPFRFSDQLLYRKNMNERGAIVIWHRNDEEKI